MSAAVIAAILGLAATSFADLAANPPTLDKGDGSATFVVFKKIALDRTGGYYGGIGESVGVSDGEITVVSNAVDGYIPLVTEIYLGGSYTFTFNNNYLSFHGGANGTLRQWNNGYSTFERLNVVDGSFYQDH